MTAVELREAFRARTGREPRLFAAPGRVNLIGEHTDYNDGYVMPIAIDRSTLVAAAPRDDATITVHTHDLDAAATFALDAPAPLPRPSWVNYVEGMTRALRERGVPLRGADLDIASDIPLGAGLSSSAALEVAVGLALSTLAGTALDPLDLAKAGQAAEHAAVGTRSGIMDQYASALSRAGHALLIDTRSLDERAIPVPPPGEAAILVCDSDVKHELASSAYNERRAECERAVEILAAVIPGVRALRDIDTSTFAAYAERLPEPIRSRARHVVSENARTLAAAAAFRAGNLARVGTLMRDSHESLRNDYAVSIVELDTLVTSAVSLPGVYGARMTGGGFGGSIVALVAADAVENVLEQLPRRYAEQANRRARAFVVTASAGAHEIH